MFYWSEISTLTVLSSNIPYILCILRPKFLLIIILFVPPNDTVSIIIRYEDYPSKKRTSSESDDVDSDGVTAEQ